MSMVHKGYKVLRSALSIALGGGAALGGSYLLSRIREKQEVETRLDRLEQMLEQLTEGGEEKKKPQAKPRAKTKAKTK